MNGEWCFYKQYFTKEQCESIISEGSKLPGQKAVLGVNGNVQNENYRRSNIHFIEKDVPQFKWLFDEMWKLAIESNEHWFGFNLTRLNFMQLAEYDHTYEGEYKKHHDVFWINGTKYHRKLSAVIQLTDPSEYDGGELLLHSQQEKPKLEDISTQGTVIFFPSFLEHEAKKVSRGKRNSLAVWFEGPHWV